MHYNGSYMQLERFYYFCMKAVKNSVHGNSSVHTKNLITLKGEK